MTTWLWIIGVTAIVWPLIILLAVQVNTQRRLSEVHQGMIAGALATDSAFNRTDERIIEMRRLIEEQDLLLAVLWIEVYGYPPGEGGFVGGTYVCSSEESLEEAWGVRPPWHVHVDHVLGEYDHLSRDADYSWGPAKSTYRKDSEEIDKAFERRRMSLRDIRR